MSIDFLDRKSLFSRTLRGAARQTGPDVAVIDSDAEVAVEIAEFLRCSGLRVAITTSAADGLLIVRQSSVRTAFVDIDLMGPIDGLHFARLATGINRRVMLVLMASERSSRLRARLDRQHGAALVVAKPLTSDWLSALTSVLAPERNFALSAVDQQKAFG